MDWDGMSRLLRSDFDCVVVFPYSQPRVLTLGMLEGIVVCRRGLMDRIFSKKTTPTLRPGLGNIWLIVNYPFMLIKNSALSRVPFIRCKRNSMDSCEVMSLISFLSIHTRCISSLSISRSSLRVPELSTSIEG